MVSRRVQGLVTIIQRTSAPVCMFRYVLRFVAGLCVPDALSSSKMQTFTVEEEPDTLRPKALDLESAGSETDVGSPIDYKAQAL